MRDMTYPQELEENAKYVDPGNLLPPDYVSAPQLDANAPRKDDKAFKTVNVYWRGKGMKTPFGPPPDMVYS